MKLSRPNYSTYIKSAAWYRKHPDWLKRSGYHRATAVAFVPGFRLKS